MKFKQIFAAFSAFALMLVNSIDYSGMTFADSSADLQMPEVETPDDLVEALPEMQSRVNLQTGMRSVFITPETDFSIDDADFTELYNEVRGFGMNAVIINSTDGDEKFFDLEPNNGDILTKAIEEAHNAGLYAYVVLDADSLICEVCEQGGGLKEGFSAAAHKFVMKYACEGILLSDYYTRDSYDMYVEYLRSGSGIGYENWLYETNFYIMRTLCDVVHRTNNTTAVGILAEDVWANASDNEEGSDTEDTVQALYDGHSDTKKYIEDKLADFVMVKAYGSTESTQLKFESVVSWWYDIAEESDVKVYVCHLNERIGEYSGWNEDQLLRQLTVMEEMENLGGSAFNSLPALRKNTLNSTDTLIKYFNDQINRESLFEDLTMISPSSLSYVTYDSTVKFMGTFDENFDVYFDGNKIQLNEAGNFFIQKDLTVGWNSFTIEHKGKKYSYSIERRIDVLKSIETTSDITVEGGTRITLEAIAYSGSSVSATINGKTVALTEKSLSDKIDANSSYSEFVGYYTVPDGIVGQQQNLGNISYYANYYGYEESAWGGSVTVEAKPEPITSPDISVEIIPDQSSVGTGEVVGRIDPIRTEDDWVKYVRVTNNYTEVRDPMTTGAVPSPEFSMMPAGTLDYYYKSTSDGYITTLSGKRYKTSHVTTFEDTGLGYNALEVKSIGDSGGRSFICLGLDYKTGFNVTTSIDFVQGFDGPYGVTNFNAKYIYITFDNVTSVTKLPSFSNCSLFSAGNWDTVTENGIPKFRLTLTLRNAGIYSGVSALYNSDGDLMLTFSVPTNGVAGKTIVIDPGHGYKVDGTFDVGAVGEVTEQSINLAVSKKLEQELTAMGASVIRLKTEEPGSNLHDRDRPRQANIYNADMYLAIHCNSVENNPYAHGCEVYYFTPWSKTLAKNINDNLVFFFDGVYADGTNSSRGDKYSYYWYTLEHGFPSVLVEMGFVSNQRECLVMANSANQTGMAKAIAKGIAAYFERA